LCFSFDMGAMGVEPITRNHGQVVSKYLRKIPLGKIIQSVVCSSK
jgi:hypothetical protein